MKYGIFTTDGAPAYLYDSVDQVPEGAGAIEVSDEDFAAFAEEPLKWILVGGARVARPTKTAEELAAEARTGVIRRLEFTDTQIARGVEDLVDVLKAKGLIEDADLPAGLAAKLQARKDLRAQL